MTTSPRTGFTELEEAETIPQPVVVEQGRRIEQGASVYIVEDKDENDPPGTCADGDAWIVAATATGDWTGHEGDIAFAVGTNAANGWLFRDPIEGLFAYVQDENKLYLYGGASWAEFTATAAGGASINAQSGTTYTLVLGDANNVVELTNGSAITLTIPANASVAFPVGTVIELHQGGAGTVTVAITTDTLVSRGSLFDLAGQEAVAAIRKVTSTKWRLTGDIA